jgi:mono/diheme cytochrome c family protein
MARRDSIDEEKRSYGGLWLVLSLLLFVGALWAIADDNIFRRPWKQYQADFGRLEIDGIQEAIAAEEQRLAADPQFQAALKAVADARAQLGSGETATRVAELEQALEQARLDDLEKDLNLRFVKSELEELRFQYDDAHHHGRPTDAIWAKIQERNELQEERQHIFRESQERIATLEKEIAALRATLKTSEDALAELTKTRDELSERLTTISLGRLPGPTSEPPFVAVDWQPLIPKIRQVVLEEFDRNAYNQPVARVDRCTSCHTGIDKAGFEDQPNPMKTHPRRELFLGKHPTGQYGCTPCHNGDGPAVNSVVQAHANYYDEHGELHDVHLREQMALFRCEMMQANCLKCHESAVGLDGAEFAARGETLFVELGCHGCHLTEGYESLSRYEGTPVIGPSLRRVGAKVDPGWLVRWIESPHEFRPRTRMPDFMLSEEQAVAVAAFILDRSGEDSAAWEAEHPARPVERSPAAVARGKELVDSVGCRACHALAADEIAGQVGVSKDIAPNLSQIAEKTDASWMYHWLKNPRGYSAVARMPSLRLSDDEARDITSYLLTLGSPQPGPPDLARQLKAPEAVAAGEKLVRKYGCAGCHDIAGMEAESRIGAELSAYGGKTHEELFFGDRTDVPHTWLAFTRHKIEEPRGYATKWIEQVMPNFDLADEDVEALIVFLKGRTEAKVPAQYRPKHPRETELVEGQRMVARYNCTGCHVIDGRGGDVGRLYEKSPASAPPNLLGEGRKVQAGWLFGFLKGPIPLRPWLKIRMPTFGFDDQEDYTIVRYFEALDDVEIPFVHVDPAAFDPANVEAGRLLATKDYLSCFSCHIQGENMPEGEADSWAPDLALAHERLKPDWIVDWINDPQTLLPGTKMPSFYSDPDNPDGPEDILGGDDDAQMRALRDYVIAIGLEIVSPDQVVRVETDEEAASN